MLMRHQVINNSSLKTTYTHPQVIKVEADPNKKTLTLEDGGRFLTAWEPFNLALD